QAARQQLTGDLRRAFILVREQAHGLRGTDPVDDVFQPVRGEVRQICFLPRLLDTSEGELHRADVWQDVEFLLTEPVAQIAGDTVKQRIAAGNHDHALRA